MFTITALTVLITTLGFIVVAYFKWAFKYWERKNVPQLTPKIPFGDGNNPITSEIGNNFKIKDFYETFKSQGQKHGGFYMLTNPGYIPIDPEYVKNILTRDFQYFIERGIYYNEKTDPLSANLFTLDGHKWRPLRTKLTPTFTSGKMKMMFETLLGCGTQLKEELDKIQLKKQSLDVKEIVACYTTDIIGSCAFGLECNSFKDPNSEFRKYGKEIFTPTVGKIIRALFTINFPRTSKFFGMRFFPTDATSFYLNVVKNIIKYRESNNIIRNDFVQILLELMNAKRDASSKSELAPLTFEEVAAQAFVFFLAGFETSSTTMMFCLYELSKNQVIQQKVRNEINLVLKSHDGKLTYESMVEMKYLGQVIDETLRKYPALPTLSRVCTKDYKIPETDIILEAGTNVAISVFGLHRDPEYYPDPEKFDPDRFTEENKAKRHPYVFLPFGEGPRNCIGLRFGLMQTKIGLSIMLQNYKFTLNEKTPKCVRLNSKSPILFPIEDILLDVTKLL